MISAEKYWNTWNPYNFAWMVNARTGFCIVPGAYSAEDNDYTQFHFDRERVQLMEHEKDGKYCRLHAHHGQAEFDLEYLKIDPVTVLLRMTNVVQPREWSIRYHMLVSLGFDATKGVMKVEDESSVLGEWEDWYTAAAFVEPPYAVITAETSDAVGQAMAGKGFKNADGRGEDSNRWATCRFVLEQSPEVCIALSMAHDPQKAKERANAALAAFDNWDELRQAAMAEAPKSTGTAYPGMIEAVRDMMNWNDMYSPELTRAYTSISKHWNDEFGGWYLFFSDISYQILLKSVSGDMEMASRNLDFALWAATADGNFAGLLCGNQRWVDRTQPPVLAFATLMYYMYSGDLTALQRAYPILRRAQDWYINCRCTQNNWLIQLGTSRTGSGDYRGTKVACKNETAMDNSPMYDEAVFDKTSMTLQMYDVGVSSQLCLDIQCTARMAELLGRPEDEVTSLYKMAKDISHAINETLWDENRGLYANRNFSGTYGLASPTSFYPLVAGIATEDRLKRSVENIFDPEAFFTPFPMIAIDARSASAKENKYWRGRTWAPQPFWTYMGLRRYGLDGDANRLAEAVTKQFANHWNKDRYAYENYNPFTCEGNDSVDSQRFYSWTALMPLMWTMEQFGVDPWNGLCFGLHDGSDFHQENRFYRGKVYDVCVKNGTTVVKCSGMEIFRSDIPARFKDFACDKHYAKVEVCSTAPGTISFPGRTPAMTRLDGITIDPSVEVALDPGKHIIEHYYF